MRADELLDAILRQDFASFVAKVFETICPGENYSPSWHIDLLAWRLSLAFSGRRLRVIVNLPPRSLKSIVCSVALPARLLGQNPSSRIIAASYSEELSRKHSRDCRTVLEADWYRRLFPRTRLDPRKLTETEITTTAQGFRLAASVGSTLTGRGGTVLIVDDPIKAFDAESETERRRVNDWYDGSFLTRLDDQERGVVVVVHQRLHENDLSGHLLEKGGYELLALPAIATEGETLQIADEQFHTRAIGDVLDPSRLGPATLEGLKASIGSRNFQAQFQQQPVPAEGNLFKAVWLKRYTTVPPRESFSRIVQSWDCAAKLASTNDYSACLTWGISRNTYYLLDVHRSRWEFPDLSRAAIAHAEMLRPDTILIEDANSGSALLQWLRQETRLNVVPIKPKLDKATRAAQQSAAVESGRVYLPESASWLGEFERELLGFPNGKHDDQVDAMVQFLQWAAEAAAREGPIVLPAGPYKDWSWKDAG